MTVNVDDVLGLSLASTIGKGESASDATTATPSPTTSSLAGAGTGSTCPSLTDERVRAEVRKVLTAQANQGGGSVGLMIGRRVGLMDGV